MGALARLPWESGPFVEELMTHSRLIAFGAVLATALAACDDKASPVASDTAEGEAVRDSADPNLQDNDGDGWTEENGDCDDTDSSLYPGNDEECDGIDNNCNGVVDEGFGDGDGDGIADCMDTEECDGVDNDGDGEIDEDWTDSDGDGDIDCPDSAEEICDGLDNDGDGEIDEGFDEDGDGYSGCDDGDGAEDCDDANADVNPGATEVGGDMVDNDCDGLIDEGSWAAGDLIISEVLNNPAAVNDPDGEWLEVYNASDRTLTLNGVIVSSSVDDDWHQITSNEAISLAPGEFAVLGSNGEMDTNGHVPVDYVYDHEDLGLSNEFDGLVLEADGITLDMVEWDDGATFPDPTGASLSLDPTYFDITANDNGDYWCSGKAVWDDSYAIVDRGTPGADNPFCWPTAFPEVSTDSTLETCDMLQLVGSNSVDSAGLALTYEWELTTAPASSVLTTADIQQTTDADPVFYPDVVGVYVFTLTVYNGEEYSQPASLSVNITQRMDNTDPVANAGEDTTYEEDADCTPISYGVSYDCDACSDYDFELDGTASSDPDGDWLGEPAWAITSGSSVATIADEDTWEPTVTVTGQTPSYGVTSSTDVEVTLTVVDCMGATATDTVMLTYECTGS